MFQLADAVTMMLAGSDEMFWPIAGVVAMTAILAATISSTLKTRQREMTRREVAAYVASGSIDKDTAVAILKTGRTEEEAEAACA